VEAALKGAVQHSIDENNVHVERAVVAGFRLRLLAFELSKSANVKLVVSSCYDPLDGARAACLLDERYRVSQLLRQVVLKCVAHLKFSWWSTMRVKHYADSDPDHNKCTRQHQVSAASGPVSATPEGASVLYASTRIVTSIVHAKSRLRNLSKDIWLGHG
jgi:hypothetical protein